MDNDAPPPAPVPTMTGADARQHPDRIELIVPLQAAYLAQIRTMAAVVAADAGFSVDEIDDLRLALGEVVTAYLEREAGAGATDRRGDDRPSATPAGDRVRVALVEVDRSLVIAVRLERGSAAVHFDALAAGIIDAVVDSCDVDDEGVTLVKRAVETNAATDTGR